MDAIILFFFMGMTCRILKVNLKLHNSLYEGLCLYLLQNGCVSPPLLYITQRWARW